LNARLRKEAPKSRSPWRRRLRTRLRMLWHSLLVLHDTPHRIALGAAIGTFVSFLPCVGIQMILGAVVTLAFRGNLLASVPPAWITNPLTMGPIFYGTYRLGAVFTGGHKTWTEVKSTMAGITDHFGEHGLWEGVKFLIDELGSGFFWPMLIGGVIVGCTLAVTFYFLIKRAVRLYQDRRILNQRKWMRVGEPGPGSDVDQGDP